MSEHCLPESDQYPPARVCVCVMMNHPFPKVIPILRDIYKDRFSHIRFLIPFERSLDEDVITVYRGSYNHAGYLTDAYDKLAQIDCDYYLIIHDDVLLNPSIDESAFRRFFALGENDGFIAKVGTTPPILHQCVWWYGLVSKMLFPKSLLFGTGIEPGNLVKYLPDADQLLAKFEKAGVVPGRSTLISPEHISERGMSCPTSRMMLHGFAAQLDNLSAAQRSVEFQTQEAAQHLAQAMLEAQRLAPSATPTNPGDEARTALPIPTVGSNYFTDLYVLPKSGLADFSHYMGVASAANLFVEMMAPTLLYACCDHVQTAAEIGLDVSGFDEPKPLSWLAQDNALAIHPIKLSAFTDPNQHRILVELLRAIGERRPIPPDAYARAGFGSKLAQFLGYQAAGRDVSGWHRPDPEYTWSSAREATIPIALSEPTAIRLDLLAPLHPKVPRQTGRVIFNGAECIEFEASMPVALVSVDLPPLTPDADGIARIKIVSDQLLRPCDLDDHAGDTRHLGFAFLKLAMIRPSAVRELAAFEA